MSLKLTFFRWFHDGCCQCVGSPCQARAENQFGIDQSRWDLGKGGNGAVLFWASNNNFINRCEECPLLEDEDDISDEEMELMVR